MADSLRSTTPVSGAGGFAGRSLARQERHATPQPGTPPDAGDRVDVESSATLARRVLRERVLACTRAQLEIGDADGVPVFAEAIDTEPIELFVGRLLSAQNQLAARRLPAWGAPRVRRALDAALRTGAAEAVDMLAARASADDSAVAVIADVLAAYGRRLEALAQDVDPAPEGR
jgi:hypothetical protein